MEYRYRLFSRISFTAETPLKVGSGNKSLVSDAMVCLDANGLPYVPGTSLAGLFRQSLDAENETRLFGTGNHGSNVILTDACLIYEGGKVVEGLLPQKTPFLARYANLPIRQHVRIGHSGAAEKGGKFDEQIVFAGSRFCFNMEILGKDKQETESFKDILSLVLGKQFRIGGGSRKGFGRIKIERISYIELDLSQADDLNLYLTKTASLNDSSLCNKMKDLPLSPRKDDSWENVRVELSPNDFFLFGSGFGDDDADLTPVYEPVVVWQGEDPCFSERLSLIPATSVKGALAHRTAYHYNLLTRKFADKENSLENLTGSNNHAVCRLFGKEGSDKEQSFRGKVLFSDVFLDNVTEKVFNHVVIDSYTGGSLDGGLFNEKVLETNKKLVLEISIDILFGQL